MFFAYSYSEDIAVYCRCWGSCGNTDVSGNEKTTKSHKRIKKVTQKEGMKITADKILFFDLDGTLVDTNLANFLSYKKAIHSVTKSDRDLTCCSEQRFNRSILKIVVPNLTETEYERIIEEKEKYYEEFLHQTILITENADILFKYSETNNIFLVTNCRKNRALTTINYFGIADKFSKIFCREFGDSDKKINKFQNAISILGISPKVVIAFENEAEEIADALNAGIEIINPSIDK